MKKKTKILLSSIGMAGLISIPLASTLAVTSCSNILGQNVSTKTFSVVQKTTRAGDVKVYSADINQDAQKELGSLTQKMSKSEMQNDFNRVLTDFYESFEAQDASGTEIEIDRIIVKSDQKADGSFDLDVVVEIERDSRDSEQRKTVSINWKPKFTLMSKSDIDQTKQKIMGFGAVEEQNGMDLQEIKELFFGEKDGDIDDYDDIGIFDKIALINKNNKNLAYLIAYELSVSDIFDKVKQELSKPGAYSITYKKRVQVDKNTPFKVPSLSLNNGSVALVPAEQPNFEFTNILDGQKYSQLFSKTELNPATDKNILDYIFATNTTNPETNQKFYDSIEKVIVDSTTSSITIKYKDTSRMPEQISIARTWGR